MFEFAEHVLEVAGEIDATEIYMLLTIFMLSFLGNAAWDTVAGVVTRARVDSSYRRRLTDLAELRLPKITNHLMREVAEMVNDGKRTKNVLDDIRVLGNSEAETVYRRVTFLLEEALAAYESAPAK